MMSEIKSHLLTKFNARSASIAIIGLGYVGLPLAVAFVEAGFTVIGIDVDQNKVKAINGGESYVEDVATTRLAAAVARGALSATTDFGALSTCDAAIICVPTPLSKTRDPDVRYLIAAGESVARYVHPGMLVSLESTTYPGTTEELLRPMLEAGGLRAGADFFLAFSPERIDPGLSLIHISEPTRPY